MVQPPCPGAVQLLLQGQGCPDAPAAIMDGRERAVCWSGWRGSSLEVEVAGVSACLSLCPVSTLQGREQSGVQVTKVALSGRKIERSKWILFSLAQLDLRNRLSCFSVTSI